MRILNRDVIKYIAMFTMVMNHIANIFLESGTAAYIVLTDIGYFTAPVMCYFLVEGYRYTASKRKYAQRLAVFAFLSEIPFCLAFTEVYAADKTISFCGMNMMFTLLLCFGILKVREQIQNVFLRSFLITLLFAASLVSDWAIIAPFLTVMIARAGNSRVKIRDAFLTAGGLFALMNFNPPQKTEDILYSLLYAVMSAAGIVTAGAVILKMYNGKRMTRGKTFSKWFFYLFYPVHLLLLGIIRICIS